MTETEIYDLVFSGNWQCNEIQETIRFIPNGSDSFLIIKLLNGIEVWRYPFERITYRIPKGATANNNQLHFFTGLEDHFIKIISDKKINVYLPGIDNLELIKNE